MSCNLLVSSSDLLDSSCLHILRCGYSTQHQENLKTHIQEQHAQQSRYFYRQKRTNVSESRQYPEASSSTSNTPLSCSFCDYTTKSITKLREHKTTHGRKTVQEPFFSGPKTNKTQRSLNFKCNECKSSFLHADEHKLHMEYFHTFS